jgi:uncharacterized protein YajQ (UPF0234 family)
MPSFDTVSEVNWQEVVNAIDQTNREIITRYDFKDSKSTVELKEKEKHVLVMADDEMRLSAIEGIIKQRMAKRGVSLKSIVFKDSEKAGGDMLRQIIEIKQGLTAEEVKRLAKLVKDQKFKVTAAIQGDALRVSGKSRDELQTVIQFLKSSATDLELQFTNFRE